VYGKNLGVLWDGRATTPLDLVHWLDEILDVRPGAPPAPAPAPRERGSAPLRGAGGLRLHGNGSPAILGGACPGLALSVGHVHTDAINASAFGAAARPPSTVYAHYFVVWRLEDQRAVSQSEPFCFPSLEDPAACDLIQFVSGLVVNATDVLLTYGTNDCGAAFARIALGEALDTALRGDAGARAALCPGLA